MSKIVITIDSVIQTKKEIAHFTKDMVNEIEKHWMLEEASLLVTQSKNKEDYELKVSLPEII